MHTSSATHKEFGGKYYPFSKTLVSCTAVPLNFVNEILYSPFILARIGGHWPFYLEENKTRSDYPEWNFRWRSLRAAYIVLMPCIAMAAIIGLWMYAFVLFEHVRDTVSAVESNGHAFTSTVTQLGVATLMGCAIVNRNGIAETWTLLNKLGNDVSASLSATYSPLALIAVRRDGILEWIMNRKRYATMSPIFIILQMVLIVLIAPLDIFESVFKYHGVTRETITAEIIFMIWLSISRLYATFIPILVATLNVTAGLYHHLALQVKDCAVAIIDSEVDAATFHKSSKSPFSKHASKYLMEIMQIGDGLEEIMEKLNNKLKIQILVILMIVGFGLVFNAFTIITHIDVEFLNRKTKIAELISVFIDATMFCAICSSASSVSHKATAFGNELGKLIGCESFSAETKARIQHTAFKLSLKPPVFSPGYIVVVNNSLLSSLVTMVTTYLIVLLQFST